MTPYRITVLVAALASLVACTSSAVSGSPVSVTPATRSTAAVPTTAGTAATAAVPTTAGTPSTPTLWTKPEVPGAKAIQGLVYRAEPRHDHLLGRIQYDTTPPSGGNHSFYWADCDGTVYPKAIANENAVHMLEHGAVWITYREGLDPADVATLSKLVLGQGYTAMSPYPALRTNVSIQSWGYQLVVDSASDPRIAQFIALLRQNPDATPELGATCSQPTFLQHPSVFGEPLEGPSN